MVSWYLDIMDDEPHWLTVAGRHSGDQEVDAIFAQAEYAAARQLAAVMGLSDRPPVIGVVRGYVSMVTEIGRQRRSTGSPDRSQAHVVLTTCLINIVTTVTSSVTHD